MKIKNIISIDYNSYKNFVGIVTSVISLTILSIIVICSKNVQYDVSKLVFAVLLCAVLLIISLIQLFIRINIVNKALLSNINYDVEIKDSFNWPRDQFNVIFDHDNISHKVILKVSKKNKTRLTELLQTGNRVKIRYIENKKNKIIFPEIYMEFDK